MTVWWPLVVATNDKDQNVVCGGNQWMWTIRNVYSGGRYCLCSCDGNNRNSMFGQWQCQSICAGDTIEAPVCGNEVSKYQNGDYYFFVWTCEVGNVVEWTWAYLVDRNNVVHWACQTYDWMTVGCCTSSQGQEHEAYRHSSKGI